MKTPLDAINWTSWFLEKFRYSDFEIELTLAEGIRSDEPDENGPVPGCFKVEVQRESRRFKVFFEYVLLLQVADESHLKHDEKEIGSKGVLQVFEKSAFLDYVAATCEFWAHDEYKHYRLNTTNETFEIISTDQPIIEEIRS